MKHARSVFFACLLLALAAPACGPTAAPVPTPAVGTAALPKEVTVVVVVTATTGQQQPTVEPVKVDTPTLPVVSAPPTPAALRVRSSKPEGSPNGIDGTVISDPGILLQFKAIGPGGEKDGDHIEKITFWIYDQNGNTVLEHTEQNVPFCIFGGDNGCAPWPKQNGAFVWGNSETRVESGEYQAQITATSDAETGNVEGNWSFTINVEVP
jgi:hypothetical protein